MSILADGRAFVGWMRMIKELIDADAIGDVKELTAWCGLTYHPYVQDHRPGALIYRINR